MSNDDPLPHATQLTIGGAALAPPPHVTLAELSWCGPIPLPTLRSADLTFSAQRLKAVWFYLGSMGLYTINNTNIGIVP